MKTVFSNHQLAHVWAQQRQAEGRTSNGNFYFRDASLYSYGSHFCVARFTRTIHNERAVLLNERRYSVSTSRHQSLARNALSSGDQTFMVHNPQDAPIANYERIVEEWREIVHEQVPKARMLKTRLRLMASADHLRQRANTLAGAFGLELTAWSGVDAKYRAEQDAMWVRRKQIEEETTKRNESEQATLLKWWNEKGREAYMKGGYSEANQTAIRNSVQSEYRRWGRGVLPIALRLKDETTVETSLGAEFPLEHGLQALSFVRHIWINGAGWKPANDGEGIRLGHFKIDEVTPDGDVRAGCHFVKRAAIEAFASLVAETNP